MIRPVAIAGPMAVGKSTVARLVSNASGSPLLSFGDLVRAEAKRRNSPSHRSALQTLGRELHDTLGPIGMSRLLLRGQGTQVVIEGVRHADVLEALIQLLPDLVFVFLTAPQTVLDSRWKQRESSGLTGEIKQHHVETGVAELPCRASLIIDTSQVKAPDAASLIKLAAEFER